LLIASNLLIPHSIIMSAEFTALDLKIEAFNARLKAAQLSTQVERRGNKLNLRGTFPPKPGSDRLRPYQQRLSLGIPATAAGLKQAEQQAKIIAIDLMQQEFSWKDYVTDGRKLNQLELTEQIDAFEQAFRNAPQRQGKAAATQTTWRSAYAPYLKKLATLQQKHRQLTLLELIYKTVNSTDPSSRSRQLCCTTLNAFAQFIKLDLPTPLKDLSGNYSPSKTQARQLPSDDEIRQHWQQIPNPAWQFVYGMMATYGLRNHEVFFCDFAALLAGDMRIDVSSSTKTGAHEVWAFYPEWIDQFNLRAINLPDIETDLSKTTLQQIGQRVTAQFRRYGIPFKPYDLRHAWAVRTIHLGLSDTVAAKMMGHSVSIHTRTYHQWITRRDQQQAVEAALNRRSSN
jgi:integrase